MGNREQRRIAGYLAKYLPDTLLRRVLDPRSVIGRRWKLSVMLRTAIVGILADCRGFSEIETFSARIGSGARKLLGLHRRLPDTTLRSTLCRLLPNSLRELLHILTYDALRRKALPPVLGFPFHAVSMDGKYISVKTSGQWAQAQSSSPWSQLRTITSTLLTSAAKPCIDAFPVPAVTNEMGAFAAAFAEHLRVYGKLATLFMYDSGAASLANATLVVDAQREYLFVLDAFQLEMFRTAQLLLQQKPFIYRQDNIERYAKPGHYPERRQEKTLRIVQTRPTRKNITVWSHARTLLEVETKTYEGDTLIKSWTRWYVTSLTADALTPEQWLWLITRRWSVETTHQILDTAFEEDRRTAVVSDELGALAFMLLRRIGYTLLALYRGVTLRAEEHRTTPWKRVMAKFRDALILIDTETVEGLRRKRLAMPPACLT